MSIRQRPSQYRHLFSMGRGAFGRYNASMNRMKRTVGLFKSAFQGMIDDQSSMMGAALAYYTMFSIAPVLIITIGVAALVFGSEASREVYQSIGSMVGERGAAAIESMVSSASERPQAGIVATVIGVITLIVGASGVFQQLLQSLNIIWKVTTHPRAGWWIFLRQRLISFGMIAVVGFVLLVSLSLDAALAAAGRWAGGALPGGKILWSGINYIVSLAVISGLFAAVFKLLPDVELRWRDVVGGGIFTAVLFVIGKALIGAYLGRTSVSSSYGAAGSLIVILLWVYYSSQILFFGAEFTRAYFISSRRPLRPKPGAVLIGPPASAPAGVAEARKELAHSG
jgi:membrane protein